MTLQYDATASKWRVTGSSNAATSLPAGANSQVQFNNGGAFGADSNLNWDNTNKRLGVGSTTPAYSMDANTGTVAGLVMHVNTNALPINPGTTAAVTLNTAATGQMAYYSGSSVISGTNDLYVSGFDIGIGTGSPDAPLSFSGSAPQLIDMVRNPTASTAGNSMTVQAGGATLGGTNLNGGNLILSSGISTGTGSSNIQFQTYNAGGSGTSDNGVTTRMTIAGNGYVGVGTTLPQSLIQATGGEVQVGSSGASCSSANAGAMRYASNTMYYCNGSAWSPFSSSCSGSASGSDTSLASGLLAYWNFNEDSGTVVNDESGNGNTGIWEGTLGSQWTTGKIGSGGNFDGSTNYVITPSASFQLSTGTISAWIKTTSTCSGGVNGFCGIVTKLNAYSMFLYSNGHLVSYDWGHSATRDSGKAINDGNWHHVVFTFQSGVTNGSAFYVDGSLATNTTMAVSNQASAFVIGDVLGAIQYFPGIIDEVGVWNVALTGTQISTLYNSGAGNGFNAMVCPAVVNAASGFTN